MVANYMESVSYYQKKGLISCLLHYTILHDLNELITTCKSFKHYVGYLDSYKNNLILKNGYWVNSAINCKVTQASGLSVKYHKQDACDTIMILKAELTQ